MIPEIKELNFPKYATLSQATCILQDMAEKTITTQVKIDGAITPDFSYDWEIEFKGEKYIMPLRQPQAAKENTSLNSTIDLTFQHWAQYQLKRQYFFTVQTVQSGTAVADKYIAPVTLNLGDFCKLFGQVLNYYYGDSITIDLNPQWEFAEEPVTIDISYSYPWDILIKFYELWAVRWTIEPNGSIDKYVIKVGYPVSEIDHIFEYGFKGGLLKVERQVQDDNIRNMLLGRGGEQNLPYRYFKDVDKNNDSFPADPDWIPELANIYFSELRGATFRSYIQGWKARHYNGTTTKDKAYAPWAWEKGYTDEKFAPVEYVKDDASIAKYGQLMGGLENNEEIYPSIQGVVVDPYGRVDQVVDVETINSDEIEDVEADAKTVKMPTLLAKETIEASTTTTIKTLDQASFLSRFEIPEDYYGNVNLGELFIVAVDSLSKKNLADKVIISHTVNVYDYKTNKKIDASVGIPAGEYYYDIEYTIENTENRSCNVKIENFNSWVDLSRVPDSEKNTWNIWVKNIWGTEKKSGETDAQYVERVWRPILGDREGNEAKVVFSTGMLSTSEDYEFVIAKGGIYYDTSKTLNGVPSHWRIKLGKSDADFESTGLYLPSTMRQAAAGDHFFFIGIDMPHQYVVWAEERLDGYKTDNLNEVKDIKPTWVVSLDKVRINNKQQGETQTLISQLHVGDSIRIADKRFILNEEGKETAYEILYLQSITYTYREPSSSSPALIPDVEVVLSNKYETIANPIATLSGEVSALAKQVGALSNVEQIIRAVGDKLYLRKDGIADRSMSPTEFFSLVTGSNFRSGIVGGASWGIYKDANGNWVVEADRFKARQDFEVNSLVINQIIARGGMIIESAAQMEVTQVLETDDSYICFFDPKSGSVANLFQVDDVAYCNRFTPDNDELKFYKRRIIAVSVDNITLTKGYDPVELPDGTTDTGVNGEGIPETGDVIIQFGNYTDTARQYAKVRDIIGGGYDRYLEGLDSVNAAGKEYYFVGKQDGQNPRWFIGYKDRNYAEWRDGNLYIKGNIEMGPDTTGLQNVSEFKNLEDKVDNIQIGGRNLFTGTKGFVDGWTGGGIVQSFTYQELGVVYTDATKTAVYIDMRSQTRLILPGTEYTLSFYAKGTGVLQTFMYPNTNATILATNGDPEFVGQLRSDGRCEYPLTENWKRYFVTLRTTDDPSLIDPGGTRKANLFRVTRGNAAYIAGAKLEKGNVPTDWSPAPEDSETNPDDLQFIKKIFPDGLINNAATVSQLLAVRDEDNDIVAGIYGGGASELEDKGFKDSAHGKLMIFAGASDLDHVATAGTRIYEDGTLITSKLIATDADISGKIVATSGNIGGFIITENSIISSQKTLDNEPIIIIDTTGIKCALGEFAQLYAPYSELVDDYFVNNYALKIENHIPTTSTTNILAGIYLDVDKDISGKRHALYIKNGHISGFRMKTRHITGAENLSTMDSIILCWNATMTFPADPEDGQIYIIKQMAAGAVTVKVGATGHYINDGRTNKKTTWSWDSGIIVIFIWDAVNKTWQAAYTNCN